MFNIRNYSPEAINTERHEADLNIILLSLNDFDIKLKNTWIICFNIWHQHQTRSRKIKGNKTQQISVKTQIIFLKTEPQLKIKLQLQVNHFTLFLLIFLPQIINP